MFETISGYGCNGGDSMILDMKASPDEQFIATVGDDGYIRLWEVDTAKLVWAILHEHKMPEESKVPSVAPAPVRRQSNIRQDFRKARLLSSSPHPLEEIKVDELKTKKPGPNVEIQKTVSGRMGLLGESDVTSRPDMQATVSDKKGYAQCVCFSSDGKMVISGCGCNTRGFLCFWNIENGQKVLEADPFSSGITHLYCAPDIHRLVVVLANSTIVSAHSENGSERKDIVGTPEGPIQSLTVSDTDQHGMLAVGYDSSIVIYQADSGKEIGHSIMHSNVTTMCFENDLMSSGSDSEDSEVTLVCADIDGAIWKYVWKWSDGELDLLDYWRVLVESKNCSTLNAARKKGDISATEVTAMLHLKKDDHEKIFTCHSNGILCYWVRHINGKSNEYRLKVLDHRLHQHDVDSSNDQKQHVLAEAKDKNNSSKPRKLTQLLVLRKHLIACGDKFIRFWSTSGYDQSRVGYETLYPLSVQFSPNGEELAVVDSFHFGIVIFSLNFGLERLSVDIQTRIKKVVWSPDGTLLASVQTRPSPKIFLWKVSDGTLYKEIDCPKCTDSVFAFSTNGQHIFVPDQSRHIHVFSVSSGTAVTSFRPSIHRTPQVVAIEVSVNYLAVGYDDGSLHIWDITHLSEIKPLAQTDEHASFKLYQSAETKKRISVLCISENQKLLASGHTCGLIVIWENNLTTERKLVPLQLIDTCGLPVQIGFSNPEENILTCVSGNGHVLKWKIGDGSKQTSIDCFSVESNIKGAAQFIIKVNKNQKSSSEGKIALAFEDSVKLIDFRDGKEIMRLQSAERNTDPWFDKLWNAKKGSDHGNLLNHLVTSFTSVAGEDDDSNTSPWFGVWLKSDVLEHTSDKAKNATEILVKFNVECCSASLIEHLMHFVHDVESRGKLIDKCIHYCVENNVGKLQIIFDYLFKESPEDIPHFFQVLRSITQSYSSTTWLPCFNETKNIDDKRSAFLPYVSRILERSKENRSQLSASDWINFGINLNKFVSWYEKSISEILKNTEYYEIPFYNDNSRKTAGGDRVGEDKMLSASIEGNFQFLDTNCCRPMTCGNKSISEQISHYIEKSDQEKRRDGLLHFPNPPQEWLQSFLEAQTRSTQKTKHKTAQNKEPVVVCYVPIYRFHGELFQEFAKLDDTSSIFTSHSIRIAVTYKWSKYGRIGFLIWLLTYIIYMALFFIIQYAYLVPSPSTSAAAIGLTVPLFIFSAIFLAQEITQAFRDSITDYLKDWTNYIDLIAYAVPPILTTICLFAPTPIPDEIRGPIFAVTTLVLFFELLNLLTAMNRIGQFVLMIYKVIQSSWIFMAFTLLFSMCFLLTFTSVTLYQPDVFFFVSLFLVLFNQGSMDSITAASFNQTNIEEVTAPDYQIRNTKVIYIFYVFFISTILLNVLIAIVNAVYSDVTGHVEAHVLRAKMQFLAKIENLLLVWFSDNKTLFPDWIFYMVRLEDYENNVQDGKQELKTKQSDDQETDE